MKLSDGRWEVDIAWAPELVRVTRLNAPYASNEEVRAGFEFVLNKLAMVHRSSHGLLVDMRAAPSARNDPEFESLIEPLRRQMVANFAAVALLVKTASGKMQLSRNAREDGGAYAVFDDEREAAAYLRERRDERRRAAKS